MAHLLVCMQNHGDCGMLTFEGILQMYGDFFEDHEEKTADCRIDPDGTPKFNGTNCQDHDHHD